TMYRDGKDDECSSKNIYGKSGVIFEEYISSTFMIAAGFSAPSLSTPLAMIEAIGKMVFGGGAMVSFGLDGGGSSAGISYLIATPPRNALTVHAKFFEIEVR